MFKKTLEHLYSLTHDLDLEARRCPAFFPVSIFPTEGDQKPKSKTLNIMIIGRTIRATASSVPSPQTQPAPPLIIFRLPPSPRRPRPHLHLPSPRCPSSSASSSSSFSIVSSPSRASREVGSSPSSSGRDHQKGVPELSVMPGVGD